MLDYGSSMNLSQWILLAHQIKKVVRLADVSLFKKYAIVITTNSGLWRYLIGDGSFHFFKSVFVFDWQEQKHHQCIWRRINGRKYRSPIAKEMTHAEIVDYTVAPFS
jgi:hypothetical protein